MAGPGAPTICCGGGGRWDVHSPPPPQNGASDTRDSPGHTGRCWRVIRMWDTCAVSPACGVHVVCHPHMGYEVCYRMYVWCATRMRGTCGLLWCATRMCGTCGVLWCATHIWGNVVCHLHVKYCGVPPSCEVLWCASATCICRASFKKKGWGVPREGRSQELQLCLHSGCGQRFLATHVSQYHLSLLASCSAFAVSSSTTSR